LDNLDPMYYTTTVKERVKHIDSRLNGFAKVLLVVVCFVFLIVLLDRGGRFLNRHLLGLYPSDQPVEYTFVTVTPNADMEMVLKQHGLWHIEKNDQVRPVVFNRYPSRTAAKALSKRKKVFFHVLLPTALIVQSEIKRERQCIIKSIAQINREADRIDFDPEIGDWQQNLTRSTVNRLLDISEKYEEVNAARLLTKVDVIPVSLILAQSAIESAWGGSRFAVHGNNMFGIWTWGDNGMVPHERADGMSHKVAVFDSLLDSVRAYTLMLNKLEAYRRFRDIRKVSRDPLKLAEGLTNYSSRRSRYVNDVKNMIKQNLLKRYDTTSLAPSI